MSETTNTEKIETPICYFDQSFKPEGQKSHTGKERQYAFEKKLKPWQIKILRQVLNHFPEEILEHIKEIRLLPKNTNRIACFEAGSGYGKCFYEVCQTFFPRKYKTTTAYYSS